MIAKKLLQRATTRRINPANFRPRARENGASGLLNGVPFTGSTMLVAGGGFCVAVSSAALKASGVATGDEADVQLERVIGPSV
jgi:hypothetical protein